MNFKVHLSVTCPECSAQYVPQTMHEHSYADPQAVNPGEVTVQVRFFPRCPACDAVRAMLMRAGFKQLAVEVAE
jgi:hypothetical protein